ncbi:protein of unknown function (plasmid) [Cupriavidus neocaledonicus]|uniref:HTH lysR-type domain-containing protein n=1 Tax=Cupriavidus neocaledonicus TaxID=1040979 RepID=A0A375HKQ4_9BURK|nr:hypothetical protein CBM2605_B170003 [Cupriavidus neocaledonicus]SPD58831.1 protein of unknown function [Cupriavidus neocaledonicus]
MLSHRLQDTSLRYFLEVVRSGSLTEAAQRLNVTVSAVSRQVAALEALLGVRCSTAARAAWWPAPPANCWPPTRCAARWKPTAWCPRSPRCRACAAAGCGWPVPPGLR